MVGWRGMVGSVLMHRMRDEGDFALIEPVFFTTSNAGGELPPTPAGAERAPLQRRDTTSPRWRACDVVITCQGGDYTNDVYPQLRAAGWKGYWIDAATTLRMNGRRRDHARSGEPAR
jgi:aspartate-semialdehyde dehydrogenase